MGDKNLTVDAKNSTVNNSAKTTGTITITDVSSATWNQLVDATNIVFNDKGKDTNFVVGKDATVTSLTVNGPAVVTNNGTVTALVVGEEATGATISNAATITTLTANGDVIFTGKKPITTDGSANVASDAEDLAAKQALTAFLKTARTHNYADLPAVGNYKDLSTLTIDGLNVTIDISKDTAEIAAIQAKPAVADGTAPGLYVMNTFARYLGALNYQDEGATVAKVIYNNVDYIWETTNEGKYLKGSNWRTAKGGTTLVSVITADVAGLKEENTITVTLTDKNNKSVDVKFAVKTQ